MPLAQVEWEGPLAAEANRMAALAMESTALHHQIRSPLSISWRTAVFALQWAMLAVAGPLTTTTSTGGVENASLIALASPPRPTLGDQANASLTDGPAP